MDVEELVAAGGFVRAAEAGVTDVETGPRAGGAEESVGGAGAAVGLAASVVGTEGFGWTGVGVAVWAGSSGTLAQTWL